MSKRTTLIALVLLALAAAAGGTVRADDCSGWSVRDISSGERWVELRHEHGQWQARMAEKRGEPQTWQAWQTLPGLERYAGHGHLNLVQSASRTAFAVIDSGSDTHDQDKILVYDARGKLLESWDFADFMTPDDMKHVSRSISHLQWLAWRNGDLAVKADSESVAIKLLSGRTLTLTLAAKPTLR